MQNKILSVIVPVYNTAPWLRRCLDSICAQSYRNLEILCVNDGSTDNSAEILAEYAAKDTRIKVFTQENAGLSAARNTALDHATGEWVTGVDSDDYLYPGVYEQAVGCITDEVDLVFFGVQNVAEDGTLLPYSPYFDLPEAGRYEMTPQLAEKLNVCFCTKLWRRRVIEDNDLRFPVGVLYEDNALYCCALPYINKIAFSEAPGYFYLQRAGSIMQKPVSVRMFVERNAAVYRYVANYYRHTGQEPETSPYFAAMFHGSYAGLTRIVASGEQEVLRAGFCRIAEELGLRNDCWEDYRLKRMQSVPILLRPFVQKYLNSIVVRFCRVPLIAATYDELGRYQGMHFLLADALGQKIRGILKRLKRN